MLRIFAACGGGVEAESCDILEHMVDIIPAVLTESEEELVRLVHIMERAGVKRAHLDICDGIFVPTRTIKGYEQLARLQTDIIFDVHLMVRNPEEQCGYWCAVKSADRFLVHVETVKAFATLASHAKQCGKTIGVAINPETPMERLKAAKGATNLVQFMTVHPGRQGRPFVPEVLEKVAMLHAAHPDITIMLDGGISPQNAHACVAAGASALVSGSYVVRSSDMRRAIEELQVAVIQ